MTAHVGQPSYPFVPPTSRQLPPLHGVQPPDRSQLPSAPPQPIVESPFGYLPPVPPHYAYRTQAVLHQPTAAPTFRFERLHSRQWSSGLCGCGEDCGSCCCAFWCYPCFTCQLATQMGECLCGPYCCGAGTKCVGLHLPSCPNLFVVAMRTKLRTKHGLEGSICKDACCVCCCEFCVTTQIYRELKHHGALPK